MNLKKLFSVLVAGINGLLGVVLVMIVMSGRVPSVSASVALIFNTNLQLCLMMVTIFKMGADSIILSRCLKLGVGYNYGFHFKKIYLVVIVVLSVVIYMNDFKFGLVLISAAILDTCSVLKISELNAKQKSIVASFSGLFYMPIACAFLILGGHGVLSISFVLFAGSFSRFVYVYFAGRFALGGEKLILLVTVPSISLMIFQQTFNFLVFRSDQIIIGILYEGRFISEYVSGGVIWAKAVEFYTAATLIAAAVVFPMLTTGVSVTFKRIKIIFKSNFLYISLLIILLFSVFISMGIFLKKTDFDSRSIPFFFQAVLVVPANLLTFILFKTNKIVTIIKAALVAILFSVLWVLLALIVNFEELILFMGFVQLFVYVYLLVQLDGKKIRDARLWY